LQKWVEAHPFLAIPADIEEMKAEHDKRAAAAQRAKLQAELDELNAAGANK
jgi:hypothetical protein